MTHREAIEGAVRMVEIDISLQKIYLSDDTEVIKAIKAADNIRRLKGILGELRIRLQDLIDEEEGGNPRP
jgi:hypothetical protein